MVRWYSEINACRLSDMLTTASRSRALPLKQEDNTSLNLRFKAALARQQTTHILDSEDGER